MLSNPSSSLMTTGSIRKNITSFALPVFFGQLFQQLYNIIDSLVLGNFSGRISLAAIGATGAIIFLLVGFFSGMFTGAGVIISRFFGANDTANVKKAIHSTVAFGLLSGIGMTILGVIFTPFILKLLQTPKDVYPQAVLYVRIYFSGIISLVLYNTAAGIFQAVGDSKHPLYYLVTASIVNIGLDILFIAIFHWGIGGAAIATVIAQSCSAILAFKRLFTVSDIYKIELKNIKLDPSITKEIIRIGLPAGLQNSVISIANMVVQANINSFGSMAIAGCGVHSKISQFVFIPINAIVMSLTTFVGQNLGAKEYERAKKGALFGTAISMLQAETFGLIYWFLVPHLIGIFCKGEPQIIAYGTMQGRTVAFFWFLMAFSHSIAATLRGAGKAIIPMFIMFSCWCILRVGYITITIHFIKDIRVVFWAYPLTWFVSSVIFLIYFLKGDWVHNFEKVAKKQLNICTTPVGQKNTFLQR
ncbi:MAG: MATE family efflux transporter [Treponema sp. CETP13]|nr:MAG: MATE family efflux transporter [Treponema sp. CETP13]